MLTENAAASLRKRQQAFHGLAGPLIAAMRRRRTVLDKGLQAREGCGYEQRSTLALVSSVANAGVVVVSAMVPRSTACADGCGRRYQDP
jgi:hypothetical protein